MNKKTIIFSVAVCLLIVLTLFVLPALSKQASAQTDNFLHGYAWSSNIGWISLNSEDGAYQVEIDSNKNLVGYAWSSNLGWLRFSPDLTGPDGNENNWGAKIDEDNNLTGWARFCSAYVADCAGEEKDINGAELGGWDGWVEMTNIVYNPSSPLGLFSGFAWGDLNAGWISFSYPVIIDPPPDGGRTCCEDGSCVCSGGGGGPSVTCSAPTTAKVNESIIYTATVNGGIGSTYDWRGNIGSGDPDPSNNIFETFYDSAGTYHVIVEAFDESDISLGIAQCNGSAGVTITESCILDGQPVPALPYICCFEDADGDGLCGEPAACSFSLSSSPSSITLNFNPSIGINIAQTSNLANSIGVTAEGCGDGLSLTATELPSGANLVCYNNNNWGTCDNLSGTIKIGVRAASGNVASGCTLITITNSTNPDNRFNRRICFTGAFGN